MKSKYFYPIFKLKIKPWIKYWLLKKTEFKGKLSEILTGFSFNLQNTLRQKFLKFEIEGNSVQNGEPSPENEVPILSAGENVNLADNSKNKTGYYNGGNFTVDNNYKITDFIPVTEGKTYTGSIFDKNGTRLNNAIFNTFDSNKNYIGQINNDSYTVEANVAYVTLRNLSAQSSYIINDNYAYKLELGSIATPYSPFGMGSITEKITNGDNTEEQTYSVYTQAPFRSIGDVRDCFVKVNGTWYERHYIERFYIPLNWSWNVSSAQLGVYNLNLDISEIYKTNAKSNYYKGYNQYASQKSTFELITGYIRLHNDQNFTTSNEVNAWLTELNNNGHPLYFDFVVKKSKITDLPCTQAQIDILENLPRTYKNETNVISIDEVKAYLKIQYWESE